MSLFEYSEATSVAMNHPPVEHGAYGVKCFDGATGVATWNGSNWSGMENIAFYSGRPLLLGKELKLQHIANILAGGGPTQTNDQRTIAGSSAVAVARHYATKMEKNRTGSKERQHTLTMCGFYLIAQNSGVNFDLNSSSTLISITDKKLLEWAYWEISEADRARFSAMLSGATDQKSALQAWLKELLG